RVPHPAEQLFQVKSDPFQFRNLAEDPSHQTTLKAMREQLEAWQRITGDSVPEHPTPDRDDLHHSTPKSHWARGELPGASRGATEIHARGPVLLQERK